MKYSHIREKTIPKYNWGGLFQQLGQAFTSMKDGSKTGTWFNSLGQKMTNLQEAKQLDDTQMGAANKWAEGFDLFNSASQQLASDLMTAKTQDENTTWNDTIKGGLQDIASGNWTSAVGNVANKILDTTEEALMGDKTFDATSEALDNATRALSKKAMKFGPWGLLAAGIIESANFADKAAGKTIQGFEVGDIGAGFNGIDTQQDSSSFRATQSRKMKQALARRAETVNMALTASDITEEQQLQATSRINSIDNVMMANRMALAGGMDTSLLGG